jgi:hypothetical protein
MDKKEAKERMKCCIWQYISEREALEALILGDDEKLTKIKDLCARLCEVNAKMDTAVDAADEKQLEKIIGEFTYPKEELK